MLRLKPEKQIIL